jgi:hypothetical protein
MSHCCGGHTKINKKGQKVHNEEQPKSRIGRYLYVVGKKEERGLKKSVKDKGKEKHDCC